MGFHIIVNKLLSILFYIFPPIGCHSVSNVMSKYKIRRFLTDSVNSEGFIQYIKENKIDLIISIASPQIFAEDILNAPGKGCINYHTALLPKYRGRQPLFWALLNDEKEIGISIHEMDRELDNGPIIVQRRLPVTPGDSLHSLYHKTIKIGPKLLIEALDKLDKECPDRIANDFAQATYNGFPTEEDAKRFRSTGKRMF
jgi:methionyl-tRNA formyltransferase